MLILVILLMVGIFFVVAMLIVARYFSVQSRAKKQARMMLEESHIDRVKAQKVLGVLSGMQDNEGKRLYSKLADRVEKKP